MEARFVGDEFLWIGTPPPRKGQGLNFIWYGVKERVIRSRQVGPQKMLAAHQAIGVSSVGIASAATSFAADLDLVFAEEVVDAGGVTKVRLEYAPINCVR